MVGGWSSMPVESAPCLIADLHGWFLEVASQRECLWGESRWYARKAFGEKTHATIPLDIVHSRDRGCPL